MIQAGDLKADSAPTIRAVSFLGEPLLDRHVKTILEAAPNAEIHNSYGPTEATVAVTDAIITHTDLIETPHHSVWLGNSLPGTSIFLIDENNAASDHQGEIVITSDQLALEYWKDPKRTAEVFRQIKLGDTLVRAYFSGDIGRRIDGRLYFVERKDNQVKIRGHRVELGTISTALTKITGQNAIAVHIDQKIYVVIEGTEPHKKEIEDLIYTTSTVLEKYERPSGIFYTSIFPKNDNDKTDVKLIIKLVRERLENS
jgi:acyl-coenzyme A synthetase/AMP-(fatty) acid ligase